MPIAPRLGAPPRKPAMRPPPSRQPFSRSQSAAPTSTGRVSPADSVAAVSSSRGRSPGASAGLKRKERDFEQEGSEETNINVFVRCRGRNEREVRENSGVVVSTDGIKGTSVELSMGSNATAHKTYRFDKVFSPAADQGMIFDEVVAPVLDEVLSGFNCTIFAYGQTGTGKTYTMTGDISDILPLPDASGIIPRALHSLFDKLDSAESESDVKCSFIELYNEELRDLLSADENAKLKIFDDAHRKRSHATLVQGVEESHIKSASKGIELLRDGSHKRQVAATKCNDLSSRSHTVFTITVYKKRISEDGEEFVGAGKLNLVDLAGSENIQRSGAENKRATEAGLINKSLLTLGRVINALVDKSTHIPYRESKLTRLLQDSLGGRTKTCIIATLSPAKSNIEETISTLDYAFRAKNIRNKPQLNQLVTKKTLLREFAAEIEKLKSELVATRSRNGVYLTAENYDGLMTESESRRILNAEQKDRIDNMEAILRNKTQELFSITTSFSSLRKDNEAVKAALRNKKDILEKTEAVLAHTRQTLAEEAILRQAHQDMEIQLATIGKDLVSTLDQTTFDLEKLHAKNKRRSDLQALNRSNWVASQSQVTNMAAIVDQRIALVEKQQTSLVHDVVSRVQNHVRQELSATNGATTIIQQKTSALQEIERETTEQTSRARDEMNVVLDQITGLRGEVKDKVTDGLNGLSSAAERISAGVIAELDIFHAQLHSSYSNLGKDLRNTFDDLISRLNAQRTEMEELRLQLSEANNSLVTANEAASQRLDAILEEERADALEDRTRLLMRISTLISDTAEAQDARMSSKVQSVKSQLSTQCRAFQEERKICDTSMDAWLARDHALAEDVLKSREATKQTIKNDWTITSQRNMAIQGTTRSVHEETVRIVEAQKLHVDAQLQTLDDIMGRVHTQNGLHHEQHLRSLHELTASVKTSYGTLKDHVEGTAARAIDFQQSFIEQTATLSNTAQQMIHEMHNSVNGLREEALSSSFTEYQPTGQTPQKHDYSYTSTLPRTESHDILLNRLRATPQQSSPRKSPAKRPVSPSKRPISPNKRPISPLKSRTNGYASPSKTPVFTDITAHSKTVNARPATSHGNSAPVELRELDVNANSAPPAFPPLSLVKNTEKDDGTLVKAQKVQTHARVDGRVVGRENVAVLSKSIGPGTTLAGAAPGATTAGGNGSGGGNSGGRVLRRRLS